jgi:hypothetical protein
MRDDRRSNADFGFADGCMVRKAADGFMTVV